MVVNTAEDSARRLARIAASDISLYNEKEILSGLENDDLFDVLAHQLNKDRGEYLARVPKEFASRNFYDRAIVDVLVRAKGHIRCRVW